MELLRRYSDYSAHVSRKVYCNPSAWEEEQDEVEAEWPEYKGCTLMSSRPRYQSDRALDPAAWKAAFLAQDAEGLQKRKQHHVHLPGPDGERRPLKHCQDARDPTKCKSGFPRNTWLTEEPLLICRKHKGGECPTKAKGAWWESPGGRATIPTLMGLIQPCSVACAATAMYSSHTAFPSCPPPTAACAQEIAARRRPQTWSEMPKLCGRLPKQAATPCHARVQGDAQSTGGPSRGAQRPEAWICRRPHDEARPHGLLCPRCVPRSRGEQQSDLACLAQRPYGSRNHQDRPCSGNYLASSYEDVGSHQGGGSMATRGPGTTGGRP